MIPPRSILYFLLALALIRGIIYTSLVPPWQAPDEPAQFERVRAALSAAEWNADSSNVPAWHDELARSMFTFGFWNFVNSPRQSYEAQAPLSRYMKLYHEVYKGLYGSRLAYAAIGWPLFLAPQQDITLQLYLVRLNTVLMNLGVIWLAYLITRSIFPSNTFLGLGVPILILFNPQHTHIMSTVNNGNLAELLAAVTLYFITSAILQGFTWRRVGAMLLFALLAMWTKATAYFLVVPLAAAGLFYLGQHWRRLGWPLLPVGLVLAGLTYGFAPTRFKNLLVNAWASVNEGTFFLNPNVVRDIFNSYWAMPGWALLYLEPIWYKIIFVACLLSLVGLLLALAQKRRFVLARPLSPRVKTLLIFGLAIASALAVQLGWHIITGSLYYRQGRSMYPVIIPISLLLMLGWQQLLPAKWHKPGLLVVTLTLILFDTLILGAYIIPFFYSRY